LIDVDDPQLMVPGDLPDRINFQLNEAEHAPLPFNRRGVVQMANLIFHSLAQRYAEVLSAAARVTGRKLRRLFIVGGGGRNRYLNRLTAERTGLEVHCGSSEASTIGNFAVQMAAFRGNHGSRSGAGTADLAKWTSTLSAVTFTDFME
jgi:rhamnulokinase